MNSHVRVTAPYSWRVVSTSSSGPSRSERMTAFRPEVRWDEHEVLGPRARRIGERRASLGQQIVEAATEELGGFRSSSRCSSWWRANGRGHAP
jgi:hypothetical protein